MSACSPHVAKRHAGTAPDFAPLNPGYARCFYLALGEREHAPFVTADRKLLKAAKQVKGVEVRML
jgi:hypothetical protein